MSKKGELLPHQQTVADVFYWELLTDPCRGHLHHTLPASDRTTFSIGIYQTYLLMHPWNWEMSNSMARCNFCDREFQNPQGVKAHLRWCPNYHKPKKVIATGMQPVDPSLRNSTSLHQGTVSPNETEAFFKPFASVVEQFTRQFAGPDDATRVKQTRQALLAGLCANLVDWYCLPENVVTKEMAVAAKVALLNELGTLPIEELSQSELTLRGEAIRNRVFAPYFRQQEEKREGQKERQHQEALRRQEASEIESRRAKRKAALIELGIARALESAAALGLTLRALALLEWEVQGRLEIFIVGDESDPQAEEHTKAAIERPLSEWRTRAQQAKKIKQERIMEDCLKHALPVVEASLPWITNTLIKTFCERFGFQPPTGDTSEASENDTRAGHPVGPDRPPSASSPTNTYTSAQNDTVNAQPDSKRIATS